MDILKEKRCNLNEVKKILINHCSKIEREMVIFKPEDKKKTDCYFFALSGTPPKGYGIYTSTAEKRMLCLYDNNGKRFKEYYLEKQIEIE